mgnify:CR=1 FL=1
MRRFLFLCIILLVAGTACVAIEKNSLENYAPAKESEEPLQELMIGTKAATDTRSFLAEVREITDGDTISIRRLNHSTITEPYIKEKINMKMEQQDGKLSVRLLAINTPEITNGKNEPYGFTAKQLVELLVHDNKIRIELDEQALFDKYERLLGHVYNSDGTSIQNTLLLSGLARVDYIYDDYKYLDTYKESEEYAKTNKIGIYSVPDYINENGSGFNQNIVEEIEETSLEELLKQVPGLTIS